MALSIVATLILLFWIAQGLYTAKRIWSEGYSLFWVGFTGVMAMLLLVPLWAVWS